MLVPVLSLPVGLSFPELKERLQAKGLCLINRSSKEGVTLQGLAGSYLIVSGEELIQLKGVSDRMQSAKRRLHRSIVSEQSTPSTRQEKIFSVEEIRLEKVAMLKQLQGEFYDRLNKAVYLTELVRENHFSSSETPVERSKTVQIVVDATEEESSDEWVIVEEPRLDGVQANISTSAELRNHCSLQ